MLIAASDMGTARGHLHGHDFCFDQTMSHVKIYIIVRRLQGHHRARKVVSLYEKVRPSFQAQTLNGEGCRVSYSRRLK